jgi:hypothetical protein
VAKVMFNIEPFNAGHIECNKDKNLKPPIAPTAKQFYIWSGSKCTAKPNQGFEFVSWQENLGRNSTQFIKSSPPSSIWDPILDFLHMKPDKPEATLNITKFGNFTANFRQLPPPIPPEYVATLFAVVASTLVGSWLTPTILAWRKAKRQGEKVQQYHLTINNLYDDGKVDERDIPNLDKVKTALMDDYAKEKISEQYYDNLNNTISLLYEQIYKKKIDSLNVKNTNEVVLNDIEENIKDAYAKGNLSEQHYNLLNEKISDHKKNQAPNNQLAPSSKDSVATDITKGSPIKK